MTFRTLLSITVLTAAQLAAAGLAGKWAGTIESGRTATPVSLILYQHGQEVSGTVTAGEEMKELRIEKAAIRGDQLTFEVSDSKRTIRYRLTVGDSVLKGEANAAGQISKLSLTPERRTNPAYAFEDGAGKSVTPAVLLYKTEPVSTPEARAAKIQGTVLLQVEIGTNGKVVADRIKVVRGLGYGLDERAAETVRAWKFKPASKNGTPVSTSASIEVNFRQP